MKRNGVYEWVFQRCSMAVIAAYSIFYITRFLLADIADHQAWVALHEPLWFKLVSTLALLVVMLNSVLAGWQIGTDYTQKVPLAGFGPLFHAFYMIGSALLLVLGLYILWGL